jgi:hypothetical protein
MVEQSPLTGSGGGTFHGPMPSLRQNLDGPSGLAMRRGTIPADQGMSSGRNT